MRKAFMCSLCHNGILGGGLYLDTQSVIYICRKVTVDKKYKEIILPLNEINELTWKWVVFPVATFCMKTGERYVFIIFNKWRFDKYYQQYSRAVQQ